MDRCQWLMKSISEICQFFIKREHIRQLLNTLDLFQLNCVQILAPIIYNILVLEQTQSQTTVWQNRTTGMKLVSFYKEKY